MCLFSVLFLMFAAGNKCCLPAPVIPIIVTLTDLQNSNNHNIEKLFGSVFLFRNFTLATFFFFRLCRWLQQQQQHDAYKESNEVFSLKVYIIINRYRWFILLWKLELELYCVDDHLISSQHCGAASSFVGVTTRRKWGQWESRGQEVYRLNIKNLNIHFSWSTREWGGT